jgi:hypothetical protein
MVLLVTLRQQKPWVSASRSRRVRVWWGVGFMSIRIWVFSSDEIVRGKTGDATAAWVTMGWG